MDNREFKVGDLVKYKGEFITVTPWGFSFGNLQSGGAELIESVEDRIARFTTKEKEFEAEVGVCYEKMKPKAIKKMLKTEAKDMGWNVKNAVYLHKLGNRLYDKKGNLIYKEGKFNTPTK